MSAVRPISRGAVIAIGLAAALSTGAASAQRVLVVASDQPAFADAARAAMTVLGDDAVLVRADDSARALLAQAKVVIAVGPLAERLVSAGIVGDTRMVSCLSPRVPARGFSIPTSASPREVFELVRQALPNAKTVGIFPSERTSMQTLEAAASEAGLRIVTAGPTEGFDTALDRLVGNSDVVWIEDLNVLPTGGSALVVKRALDQAKSVIGPNRATVLGGALAAIVPDPIEHGRSAAELAMMLVRGGTPDVVQSPAGRLVLNGALLRTLGVALPPALARRAETLQ